MKRANRTLCATLSILWAFMAPSFPIHAQQPAPTSASPASTAPPSVAYPDSVSGLEHLAKDLLQATENRDSTRALAIAQSMLLPNAAAWYHQTYGDFSGHDEIVAYDHDRSQNPYRIMNFFKRAVAVRSTCVHIKRYDVACDDNDGENTFPRLESRLNQTPLYDLRLYNGAKYFRLWPLAYVDGTFRYLGEPKPWKYFPPSAPSQTSPNTEAEKKQDREAEQKTEGSVLVTAGKLITRTTPQYPDVARGERLQGTVSLNILVDKDGKTQYAHVSNGYCSLSTSALDAVRQWRFAPTVLGGQPVKVTTSAEVVFRMGP